MSSGTRSSRCSTARRWSGSRRSSPREDDRLPERLLSEPLPVASGRVATLTPERLRDMIDGYYASRGLDREDRPDPASLANLRLS